MILILIIPQGNFCSPSFSKNQNLRVIIDVIAFKFLAMHFGITLGIKQKEFPQEKSQCCYFDKDFDSVGSPHRPKCTAFDAISLYSTIVRGFPVLINFHTQGILSDTSVLYTVDRGIFIRTHNLLFRLAGW